MNKISVKVIKRKEASALANIKTRSAGESKHAATMSVEKLERCLHRKMADTVSNWISECSENKRAEEISAISRMFGSESLLSQTT